MKVDVHIQPENHQVDSKQIHHIAETVIDGEQKNSVALINIVLVDDAFIQDLNVKYLQKDNPTDVIAFPMVDDDIFGEVYVSLETAQRQSSIYEVTFFEEVARLVIHGLLHLFDYDDQSEEQKSLMTEKEDFYLSQL